MTNDELARLKALCAAATSAPWKPDVGVYEDPDGDDDYTFARGPMVSRKGGQSEPWRAQGYSDAKFLAAARTALPLLIAEIERMRPTFEAACASTDAMDRTMRSHRYGDPWRQKIADAIDASRARESK